jgi:hypothetical protein
MFWVIAGAFYKAGVFGCSIELRVTECRGGNKIPPSYPPALR